MKDSTKYKITITIYIYIYIYILFTIYLPYILYIILDSWMDNRWNIVKDFMILQNKDLK